MPAPTWPGWCSPRSTSASRRGTVIATPATTITAITASTTPNRRRSRAPAVLAAGLGALLVALALPRTLAYGVSAPDDAIVAALSKWPPPSPTSLLDAATTRRASLARRDDGHLHTDL